MTALTEPAPAASPSSRFIALWGTRSWAWGLLLILLTVAVFYPVAGNEFVSFGDDVYLTDNPQVHGGLTWTNLAYAFTSYRGAVWHPLTWLSHLIDVQLFGLYPTGHHLHSVLLHAVAAALLLASLHRATGRLWPSLFTAALFALHPLRVESVAWAAERKDVLATLFWLLTVWLWVRYSEAPSRRRYAAVFGSFLAGLLAKPMLVTLPAALVLLDWWPLRRWTPGDGAAAARRLLVEKIPLLVPAVAIGAITVAAERSWGAVSSLESIPIGVRVANALLVYATYLGKTLWPANLAVLYPLPLTPPPLWQALASLALLVFLSLVAWRLAGQRPYLLVGWLWYLGTLVPVIGLVQIGSHALADRFTYVPQIGLLVAGVWTAADLARSRRGARALLAGLGIVAVIGCAVGTRHQLAYWRNSTTLFTRTLAVTRGNYVIHTNLGIELGRAGRLDRALTHFDQALAINPRYAPAWNNRGIAYAAQGRLAEAIDQYHRALALRPGYGQAHYNLGAALMAQGDLAGAAAEFRRALDAEPEYLAALNNLGIVLASLGETAAAAAAFERLLSLAPEHPEARRNLLYLQQHWTAPAPSSRP